SMLLGEAAVEEDITKIRSAIAEAGYSDIIHQRTMHLGPEDILVTAKVAPEPSETLADLRQRTDDAENRIRAAVPAVRRIFIEPDVRRGSDAP
ncbi:MAG: cation transporter, partial [Demequina sp.]